MNLPATCYSTIAYGTRHCMKTAYRNHFSIVRPSVRHKTCPDKSSVTTRLSVISSKLYRKDQYQI